MFSGPVIWKQISMKYVEKILCWATLQEFKSRGFNEILVKLILTSDSFESLNAEAQ